MIQTKFLTGVPARRRLGKHEEAASEETLSDGGQRKSRGAMAIRSLALRLWQGVGILLIIALVAATTGFPNLRDAVNQSFNISPNVLHMASNQLKETLGREMKAATDAWPGQPIQTLNAKPEQLKLVRIGHGGPVENVRDFVLEHLDEFLEVYKNRPDKTNTCGIRFTHSLAIYTIAKRLHPTTIVESGVNSGQSTYFFRRACPNAKIISIDPEVKPVHWIDETNNEYLVGQNFTDFDQVNWGERISKGDIDPAKTLVFVDDHRGFYKRFATFTKFGFRHLINEDNYKQGEGATRFDKEGFAPKQMWQNPTSPETEWLFYNTKIYAEFPPILPPYLSEKAGHSKKPQGGFLHHTDDLTAIEEPLLRPDTRASDRAAFEKIVSELDLDATMVNPQSYQELMGYCFLCYMEIVPLSPSLKEAWKFGR